VLNVGKLKEHDYAYIEEEMKQLTAVARKAGICCKVIFETCFLTQEEIIEAARIAARVKPDFIKTSTGFGTAGASPENVRLMKENCGPLRSADIFLHEKKEPGLFPILIMRMIPSGLRSFRHFFFDLFRRNQRLGIFRIPACFPVKEEHENK